MTSPDHTHGDVTDSDKMEKLVSTSGFLLDLIF